MLPVRLVNTGLQFCVQSVSHNRLERLTHAMLVANQRNYDANDFCINVSLAADEGHYCHEPRPHRIQASRRLGFRKRVVVVRPETVGLFCKPQSNWGLTFAVVVHWWKPLKQSAKLSDERIKLCLDRAGTWHPPSFAAANDK